MQVIDILDSAGPATAGQLAELTGLTTGAITGMLNRLEEAGLVRRERDPEDGRRVIVRLTPGNDKLRELGPVFDSIGQSWGELTARYDDEQVAFLLAFLRQSNTIARDEIARLREAPEGEPGIFSAPLGDLESARLVVASGGYSRLALRADARMTELYKAHFKGPAPTVRTKDGEVSIRYPRRLWALSGTLSGTQRVADVALSAAVPWRISIQGSASETNAHLRGLDLAGLEIKGGMNMIDLELPVPSGTVPVQLSGAASNIVVRRPAGVAARVHLKGWVATFIFDDQTLSAVGNDVRLQSAGFDASAPRYEIEVSSSASMVTITTS